MRVAIVTHNVVRGDGQGRVNYEITRHGLAQGVEVVLIADRVDPDLLEMGATWEPVHPWCRRPNLPKVWEFSRRADQALRRSVSCFDVVHANGFVLTHPHQVNTCHFVHQAWAASASHPKIVQRGVYGAYQGLYSSLNARWEADVYRRANVIVGVSERVADQLVGTGLARQRLRVIPNGVDLDEFQPGKSDRSRLGLPSGVPLALFIGDLRSPRKNLETVLHALTRTPGLHLAVVGSAEGSDYPRLAASLRLEERVYFLGYRRDIPEILRSGDLFVLPSRYEACALVLLEALACGTPVVTARTAGGAELLSERCGIVLEDPDDVAALTKALHSLLDDPERLAGMREEARRTAENYSWRRMAQAYLALYREQTG